MIQDVQIIADGAIGPAFRCPHLSQIFAYWAPGNIYAQRGTLAFFWRARDPVGKTPFPIFQVSYSDHSSIDMAWLRIDYNGHGFDAFVTDASLARARVSYSAPLLPNPDQWIHFALAWDETQGVRFYVDGKLVGKKDLTAVFYAGLDQFGAHGDVIGPQDVATMEQHIRGGDIDEIRIYDQMLVLEDVARLAGKEAPSAMQPLSRALDNPTYRNEWWLRYGWNRPGDFPPYLASNSVSIRKVEILDAYDLKQWFWKANDGIRETTWPSPYNRSRLPGRNDYFPRPDWNCYSSSGKAVTFSLPDEPWNHIEIAGSAFGSLSYLNFDKQTQTTKETHIFDRPPDQERTFHRLPSPSIGGKIRFDNTVQETPVGEFSTYYVSPGSSPRGTARLTYTITEAQVDNPALDSLLSYIHGRFMSDEQSIVVALPEGAPRTAQPYLKQSFLPLVHILIPFDFRTERPGQYERKYAYSILQSHYAKWRASYTWENVNAGLDGIAIDIPPLKVKPTHGEFFPLNIQIKDPLWPDRNLLDFSFCVKPNEARTLWLDTRDRILPNGYSLYITIAGGSSDFSAASLVGARLSLVFKDRNEASREHELDRFTQVKDNAGNFLEWGSNKKRLRLYDRFDRDITDVLRVNPEHSRARCYWSYLNSEQGWPSFNQPIAPRDVPVWAFRQVEVLRLYQQFIDWWIDNRQIENGEFGGGLSDDGDLTHLWPGAALMGVEPAKITRSVHLEMDAIYNNGMFTNGLNTITTDPGHAYEEGIQVQSQVMLLEYGDPKIVERMMETARALVRITGIDNLGHRHIRSSLFSASEISEDPVWAFASSHSSYLILHPGLLLVEYNGNPSVKKFMLELADGLLAHRRKDAGGSYYLPKDILFPSGEERGKGLGSATADLFWAAWRWTGDAKYLLPIVDRVDDGDFEVLESLNANLVDLLGKRASWGRTIASQVRYGSDSDFERHVAWQSMGDQRFLEEYYGDQIQSAIQRMAMFTEDHWWVDRVGFPSGELQRSRLGGVAAIRGSNYPGHVISWSFNPPATARSVGILVLNATTKNLKIAAFNLGAQPVEAVMTAWDLDPGTWEVTVGADSDGDLSADTIARRETLPLERTKELELSFAPKTQTIVQLELKHPGASLWLRPDLAIGRDDIIMEGRTLLRVKVHSLGSVDAPPSFVVLKDLSGKTLGRAAVPALKAPVDLLPQTAEVSIPIPPGIKLSGCTIEISAQGSVSEVTTRNNQVQIP